MLFKLLFAVFVLSFVTISRSEDGELKEGSGHDTEETDVHQGLHNEHVETKEEDDEDDETSGAFFPRVNVPQKGISISHRHPPSAGIEEKDPYGDNEVEEEEEEEGNDMETGGDGIIIDEGNDEIEKSGHVLKEPVAVKENSLITHPGILAAIIVGGVLVLVCLIIFFILIICCVRRKDEGTYDLDKAMKQKLKYVTYTDADAPDKEFFA